MPYQLNAMVVTLALTLFGCACNYFKSSLSAVELLTPRGVETRYVISGSYHTNAGLTAYGWYALLTEEQVDTLEHIKRDCSLYDKALILANRRKEHWEFPLLKQMQDERESLEGEVFVLIGVEPIIIGVAAHSDHNQAILREMRSLKRRVVSAGFSVGEKNPAGMNAVTQRFARPATTACIPLFDGRRDTLVLPQGSAMDLQIDEIWRMDGVKMTRDEQFHNKPLMVAQIIKQLDNVQHHE